MTAASSPACTHFNALIGCPQTTTTTAISGSENGSSPASKLLSQSVDTFTYFKINAMDPINPLR